MFPPESDRVNTVNDVDEDIHSVVNSDNGAANDKGGERATLASKENRIVAYMKSVVVCVLLTTSFFVSMNVYSYIREDQMDEFQSGFAADATKLIQAFHHALERQVEAVDALSVAITSHAKSSGETFPNVTLPDFELRFSNVRALTGSFMVAYYPVVTDDTRDGWEAYQIANQGHLAEAEKTETALRAQQDELYPVHGNERSLQNLDSEDLTRFIHHRLENGTVVPAAQNSGPYLPLWQISPLPVDKGQNHDILSLPAVGAVHRHVMEHGQAALGKAINLETNGQRAANFMSKFLPLSQYRNVIDAYIGDPASNFVYPVRRTFNTHEVAGVLRTNIYWRLFFKNVLPDNTRGIICVLENNLNQTFTYKVSDTVIYMGSGDRHDAKYNHMEKHSDDPAYQHVESIIETKSFTSLALDNEFCQYKLRVYPSSETEQQHVNRFPIKATLVILCVFVFTSVVFILYTIAVGRRQDVVMDRAVASGAIVSSLFPSQVRELIYQENETDAKKEKKHWSNQSDSNGTDKKAQSRPIANVFDATTILFADMVGFTAWCAKRTPVQVFELLETLYQAFDEIAVRRKVFKVETIGDCYVAVAGLPEPQEDHAVIMATFADACMVKMNELTSELAHVLGSDTATLVMRVGLHSGSVTGGVLRGQKSRFQLFGDTMNMASRMESNGLPGRIHVSYETATELKRKGKSNWITPRDDKIVAKGKGEVQTYWVSPRAMTCSVHDETNDRALESVEI